MRPVRATELTGDDVASLSNPVFGVALPLGVKPPPPASSLFLASVVQDQRWTFDAETKCFPPSRKAKVQTLLSRQMAQTPPQSQCVSVCLRRAFAGSGSLSSSALAAEASECPRLETKPSCGLGAGTRESIRRPDS